MYKLKLVKLLFTTFKKLVVKPSIFSVFFLCSLNSIAQNCTINAGPDQNICTSTTTLFGTGSGVTVGNNNWIFLSGPTTPVIVSATTQTSNVTGMTVPGAYSFANTQQCGSGELRKDTIIINASPSIDVFANANNRSKYYQSCNTANTIPIEGTAIPAGWTGKWTSTDFEIIFGNENSAVTTIGIQSAFQGCTRSQSYNLTWTLTPPSGSNCSNTYAGNTRAVWYGDLANIDFNRTYSTCANFVNIALSSSCYTTLDGLDNPASFTNVFLNGVPHGSLFMNNRYEINLPNDIGTYTFDLTLTTPCGSRTYTGFTVTKNAKPSTVDATGNPNFTREICLATSNPSSVVYNFTAAESGYTYSGPTIYYQPPGSSTPTGSISVSGTSGTVIINQPSPSGWVPGNYTIQFSVDGGSCSNFQYFNIYVFDATNPLYDVRDTIICAPAGSPSASITIPNPVDPLGYMNQQLLAAAFFEFTSPSGVVTTNQYLLNGSNLFTRNFENGTTTVVIKLGTDQYDLFAHEWICGGGTTTMDSFKVTVVSNDAATAGTDQSVDCIGDRALAGNVPVSPRIGTWTVVSKPAASGTVYFSNPHDPAANIRGIGNGAIGTYTFRWTLTSPNDICPAASDDVDITSTNSCALIVPLTLLNFNAEQANGHAKLRWITASEQNTARFEVEHSTDSRNFTKIGTKAAAGFSNSTISYLFTDTKVVKGANFYRIKMIDTDGIYTYSPTRLLDFSSSIKLLITPNPANSYVTIKGLDAGMQLNIINADGRMIKTIKATGSIQTIQLDGFASGLYLIQALKGNAVVGTEKFIKK